MELRVDQWPLFAMELRVDEWPLFAMELHVDEWPLFGRSYLSMSGRCTTYSK